MQLKNIPDLKIVRKKLRKEMPKAEIFVWSMIKYRTCGATKFRRQYSIDQYILDFYAPSLKLALELDGESHYLNNKQEEDRKRDIFLNSRGIKVIRILNTDIYKNLSGVFDYLEMIVIERKIELEGNRPQPLLSPGGEPQQTP